MRYLLACVAMLAATRIHAEPLVATAGDSIVQTYPDDYPVPVHGWSQELPKYFNGLAWQDFALGGQSTKTFIEQGRWDSTLAVGPSFVLIEFGHNDAYTGDSRYAPADTVYQDNLRLMVNSARSIGAEPILVTPTAYRAFAADGKAVRITGLTPYVSAMKSVGSELGVGVIDLQTATLNLYDSLGPSESQTLLGYTYNGTPDVTHFSAYGADQVAKLMLAQMSAASPSLAACLVLNPLPIAWTGVGSSPADWDVVANWSPGMAVPDGTGVMVSFGSQAAASSLVDMGSVGRTVGGLTFAANTSTTIRSTGSESLTLDNGGNAATINVAGSHTIGAPVVLHGDVNISGTGSLNLSGGISGNHAVNVLGGSVTATCIQVDTLTIGGGVAVCISPSASSVTAASTVAVPEPSAFVLVAVGAVGLLVGRGWRRRNAADGRRGERVSR